LGGQAYRRFACRILPDNTMNSAHFILDELTDQ
jgi:hypothetical protein